MKTNRIELMLYGSFPRSVEVKSNTPFIKIRNLHLPARTKSSGTARYLFVEIELGSALAPGNCHLELIDGDRIAQVPFPIHSRSDNTKLHQGFDASDTVYLIVPDRFANGDRNNDSVEGILDEFHPGQPSMRHGGDLRGIIDRLGYLKDLGITAIWLTPVLENNGTNSYHGYKATDLYRIDPRFGSNQMYRTLVREAHAHGIKVIFDHVSNHIGIRHPWLAARPEADWFHGDVETHLSEKHYLLSITDPYAAPEAVRELKSFWFVDKMPDLNQSNPRVARYLIQNMIWWIEFSGLDGIREDTYPYADQGYLANWAKTIRDEFPRLNIVGEIWATHPAYIAQFQDQSKLDTRLETHLPAVMDFPLMTAMREFVSGKGRLRDIYEIYAQDFLYANPNQLFVFLDNHDIARIALEADGNLARARLALTILLTSRGIPQLLYGTELGLVGGRSHVELRTDFPGGFPGHIHDATTVSGRVDEQKSMYQFTKQLLQLRNEHPAITKGKLVHCAPTWKEDTYQFVRIGERETVLVVANGGAEARSVTLDDLSRFLHGPATDLKTGKPIDLSNGSLLVPTLSSRIIGIRTVPGD